MSKAILLSILKLELGRLRPQALVLPGLALLAILGAAPAKAQSVGLTLANSKSCIACHTVDHKRVGPAFRAVADRFAGKPGAQDYLAQSIRNGGGNRWGAIPMPAQPQISPQEAQILAEWILSLAENESEPVKP